MNAHSTSRPQGSQMLKAHSCCYPSSVMHFVTFAAILVSSLYSTTEAFSRSFAAAKRRHLGRSNATLLCGRKSSKRRGGTTGDGGSRRSRSGRRGSSIEESDDHCQSAAVVSAPHPSTFRRSTLTIQSADDSIPPIDITICDIDDAEWWEAKTSVEDTSDSSAANAPQRRAADNPFGSRAWPSSLAVAELLAGLPSSELAGRSIVELGCGTGIASIAAAKLGATVLATDVSPLALELTRRGWKDTKKGRRSGSLSTGTFDLFSNDPIPIPRQTSQRNADDSDDDDSLLYARQPIVVATSVLYESSLVDAVARRVVEAAALGAWVIVGDCDSSQRDDGRRRFEFELDRRLKSADVVGNPSDWVRGVARCPKMGWREKHVRLLHLNSPML